MRRTCVTRQWAPGAPRGSRGARACEARALRCRRLGRSEGALTWPVGCVGCVATCIALDPKVCTPQKGGNLRFLMFRVGYAISEAKTCSFLRKKGIYKIKDQDQNLESGGSAVVRLLRPSHDFVGACEIQECFDRPFVRYLRKCYDCSY